MQTAQRHGESSEHRTDQFTGFHVQFKKESALRTIRECACAWACVRRTVRVLQTFNRVQAINRCCLVAEINVTNGDYSDQTIDWVIRNSTAGMNPSSLYSIYRGSSPVLGTDQKWEELRPPKRAQGQLDSCMIWGDQDRCWWRAGHLCGLCTVYWLHVQYCLHLQGDWTGSGGCCARLRSPEAELHCASSL
jgi:hypothetical protein